MGSVGQGGAVSPSKTRSASSPFSRRTALSELLKIRVSFSKSIARGVCDPASTNRGRLATSPYPGSLLG